MTRYYLADILTVIHLYNLIYLQALEIVTMGTFGRYNTMHEVDEVWRENHLKEEQRVDVSEKKDIDRDFKKFEDKLSESKNQNLYDPLDAQDSEDSLANMSDDLLPQNDEYLTYDDKNTVPISPFSSLESSHR